MQPDAQRYLEHLCDAAIAPAPGPTDRARALVSSGRGFEPFGVGSALRFSPARTKAVLREVLQHNLLTITVVTGDDGLKELCVTPNGETARWYARVLRFRAAAHRQAVARAPHVAERRSR